MKILMSPIVRDRDTIWYDIEENKITATINGVSDTFDFTDMPDGELQVYDSDGGSSIETTLVDVPILGAVKKDGVLAVKILFSIDMYEKDERLLFPEPLSLDEFNDLMDELAERNKEVESDDGVDPEDSGDETENINIGGIESDGEDDLENR